MSLLRRNKVGRDFQTDSEGLEKTEEILSKLPQ